MPVTNPICSISVEEYYSHRIDKNSTKEKIEFHCPAYNEATLDFTSMVNARRIELKLQNGHTNDVFVKVNSGVSVYAEQYDASKARVHVIRPDGDHSKALGHCYYASDDLASINGKKDFVYPQHQQQMTLKVGEQLYLGPKEDMGPGIFCRHLVQAILQARAEPSDMYGSARNWKAFREEYFTEDKLQEVFVDQIDSEKKWLDIKFTDVYKVPSNDLGAGLVRLVEYTDNKTQLANGQSKEYYFPTILSGSRTGDGRHACLAILKIKQDDEGQRTYKLKWYDPNQSRTHVGFNAKNPEEFAAITFDQLTTLRATNYHYDYGFVLFHEITPNYFKEGEMQHLARTNGRVVHSHYTPFEDDEGEFVVKQALNYEQILNCFDFKKR